MQFILILVGLFAAGTEVTNAEPAQPPAPPMVCETGPVQKIFGGTSWNVLSCDDSVSMIVVSAKGNPASPFYFVLKPDAVGYRIYGEGNGDKKASDAAGDALTKMTVSEFTTLLAETKNITIEP